MFMYQIMYRKGVGLSKLVIFPATTLRKLLEKPPNLFQINLITFELAYSLAKIPF